MADKSIGALWKNKNYLSGVLELDNKTYNIIVFVFKNTYKKESKPPDYKIYFKRPKEQAKSEETKPKDENQEDIPF